MMELEESATPSPLTPPSALLVVAVALIDERGHVLMHQRPRSAVHGGLWEFPGGKLEPGETPEAAAVREIAEELGVVLAVEALSGVGFASGLTASFADGRRRPLVILLYAARGWEGEPVLHEGEAMAWLPVAEIAGLAMPELDYPLARALEAWLGKNPGA